MIAQVHIDIFIISWHACIQRQMKIFCLYVAELSSSPLSDRAAEEIN